ncbi:MULTISPECIES: YerC/YecD family TrpR-related protein [Dictyoglomus]|uniref:TrpR like protein, YerC/YecD n=1 Tax=Dictyoglomus turgidum (strain DSM 6724 / Z-1310) TaxID=515635 RepID=B8E263_DICTD|nr:MULTISPECIES: YerC/YecD family TrpR-related protein [Dictyoglomus]ACK42340.1 TrpR like protein, YerC/YecD [Dictyoglomus turgidum DSM 6724]PNV80801.1 MAG: DNA-binding transcriptional regulator [Dictyoglomus turgidum]HBU32205.1 DNA-binding transcriptional regulator [Dictyoglomus sp.]
MSYNPKWIDDDIYFLVKALLTLKNEEEVLRFLEDICTITEIKELSQRLKVAKMLYEGKSYEEIERETGTSSATISRVKKFLLYGAEGYKTVLDRLIKKG